MAGNYIYVNGLVPYLIFILGTTIVTTGWAIIEETINAMKFEIPHTHVDSQYQEYLSRFGKSYGDSDEYEMRR